MTSVLWVIDKSCLRDGGVRALHGGICRVSEDVAAEAIRSLNGVRKSKISTNGNGKCGLHAVFGWPDAFQELKVEEHARFIQTLLPATRIELHEILSLAGNDRLAHVLTDIWPSYINTFFSKQDEIGWCPVSPEARSFHRNLSLVEHFGILQACKDKYALNMASC